MIALNKALACHKTEITDQNAQDRSPNHIHHSEKHGSIFQSGEVGQITGGIGDQTEQSRPQEGGFERVAF